MRILKSKKIEKEKQEQKTRNKFIILGIILGIIISSVLLLIKKSIILSLIILILIPACFFLFFYFSKELAETERIKKIESVFPDFLQLMSSNLRAGMTIDRSMLLSVRAEFDPLDKEIQKVGREIATGKNIETALLDMAKRIGSEKMKKTIMLIVSGIRSGGNLATLLEETSSNMRERIFIEKKASSNVLMYVIFIFIAVAFGAPALFSLSSLLVETLTNLLSGLPTIDASLNMPFTLSSISISINFIKYFAVIFIIVTDILAALILGLVSKGEEKEGIKFLIPLLSISLVVFFAIRFALAEFILGIFG